MGLAPELMLRPAKTSEPARSSTRSRNTTVDPGTPPWPRSMAAAVKGSPRARATNRDRARSQRQRRRSVPLHRKMVLHLSDPPVPLRMSIPACPCPPGPESRTESPHMGTSLRRAPSSTTGTCPATRQAAGRAPCTGNLMAAPGKNRLSRSTSTRAKRPSAIYAARPSGNLEHSRRE